VFIDVVITTPSAIIVIKALTIPAIVAVYKGPAKPITFIDEEIVFLAG